MSDKIKVEWVTVNGDRVGTVRGHPEIAVFASRFSWMAFKTADGTPVRLDADGMPSRALIVREQVVQKELLQRYGRRTGNHKISPFSYAILCAERWAEDVLG